MRAFAPGMFASGLAAVFGVLAVQGSDVKSSRAIAYPGELGRLIDGSTGARMNRVHHYPLVSQRATGGCR